jgi:hypothetical protein
MLVFQTKENIVWYVMDDSGWNSIVNGVQIKIIRFLYIIKQEDICYLASLVVEKKEQEFSEAILDLFEKNSNFVIYTN